MMRSIFFAMYAFQTNLKLILSTILLIVFSIYSGRIHPHKNKIINIQELLLLINLTIVYAVSYQCNDRIFCIVTNAMITLVFLQLFTIVLYHFITYTCSCDAVNILQTSMGKLLIFCCRTHYKHNSAFDVKLLNIPERDYNYSEYQDGLVSDDFK